jgi:hypothetical protein
MVIFCSQMTGRGMVSIENGGDITMVVVVVAFRHVPGGAQVKAVIGHVVRCSLTVRSAEMEMGLGDGHVPDPDNETA